MRQRLGGRDAQFLQFEIDVQELNRIRRDLRAMGRDFSKELPTMLLKVMERPERIMRRLVSQRVGVDTVGKARSTGATLRAVDKVARVYGSATGARVWVGVGITEGTRRNPSSSKDLGRGLVHGWLEFGSRNHWNGRKRAGKFYRRDTIRQDPARAQADRAIALARRLIDRSLRAPRWVGKVA